ncbi:hypothetical protein [Streptomyces sp. BK79]|uniref:hypothetical protein n=1 Tax=Streptomyces sp. BK79 TaxID=3350097 RepID=UPI00376FE3A9
MLHPSERQFALRLPSGGRSPLPDFLIGGVPDAHDRALWRDVRFDPMRSRRATGTPADGPSTSGDTRNATDIRTS